MLDHDTLAVIWFILLGVLLTGYVVLDGFDLGVGILHLVARKDDERRVTINSIGPLWDGNEVWLITFGGALFAAYRNAYATIFSAFYSAFMLLLLALIFRAVSIEFRSKVQSPRWRSVWDVAFSLSSLTAALLFGVAGGNIIQGIAIDQNMVYQGTFFDFLTPYALIVGLLTVTLFAMHGSIYLFLKTEGDLQQRIKGWMWRTFFAFAAMFALATGWTWFAVPEATQPFFDHWWLAVVPILNVLAILNIPRAIHKGKPGFAFVSSSCVIIALAFLLSVALFPNLVRSSLDPLYSISIFEDGRSSAKTLGIMLLIAGLGMPCVLAYSAVIYWTFRGKVKLDSSSY